MTGHLTGVSLSYVGRSEFSVSQVVRLLSTKGFPGSMAWRRMISLQKRQEHLRIILEDKHLEHKKPTYQYLSVEFYISGGKIATWS